MELSIVGKHVTSNNACVSDTQKMCIITLNKFPIFFLGPNIISDGLTNRFEMSMDSQTGSWISFLNKRAQSALGHSPEVKIKGHSKDIYRGPLMLSTKYW